MPAEPGEPASGELPLFPLQAVLFPGGLLGLSVFEARYLDLITACLRNRADFGVVSLQGGSDAKKHSEGARFEQVGTRAGLISVDSERPGILLVRCRGTTRFRVDSSRQQPDGLWLARTRLVDDDEVLAPDESLQATVRALAATIPTLKNNRNEAPFLPPYRFDDAGWVANRWCEILPISQAAKQKLMELPDPTVRLELVDDFLRSKGVIT